MHIYPLRYDDIDADDNNNNNNNNNNNDKYDDNNGSFNIDMSKLITAMIETTLPVRAGLLLVYAGNL